MTSPLTSNAEVMLDFWRRDESTDRHGWQPGSFERVVLPDPVVDIERDSDDRIVFLRLARPASTGPEAA